MKYPILAAIAALAVGTAASAHAQTAQSPYSAVQATSAGTASVVVGSKADPAAGSTAASLNALLADWNRAGFNPPSKPSQFRVYGRNGYVTSGPEYNAMVGLIRTAVADEQHGRDQDAALHIAAARGLLAGVTPSAVAAPTKKV
jgi:hypothetical protein